MAFDAVGAKAKPRPSIAAVTQIRKCAISSPVVIGDTLSLNSQLRHAFRARSAAKIFFSQTVYQAGLPGEHHLFRELQTDWAPGLQGEPILFVSYHLAYGDHG